MNFPFIKTQRLMLRPIVEGDGKLLYKGLANNHTVRFYGVEFQVLEDAQIHIEWLDSLLKEQKGIWWGIGFHSQQSLIGACGFYNLSKQHKKTEVEFWLQPEYWQQGVMTEALPNIVGYAFEELGMHRIEAFVEKHNNPTKDLLQKIGFAHEGCMVDSKIQHGRFVSIDIFAKVKV
jgi:[ribosomal protein S5]-alanine N-acetyltransferase